MSDFRAKIVDVNALVSLRHAAGSEGRSVMLCHGCFDIVHPGHIRYLHFAKQQGDVLVVSLTADVAIDKGPLRPYIPQELRAENLAALECVDYVYVDPCPTACSLLVALRPDIYVKGREYEVSDDPGFLQERQAVESYGGRIVFCSGQPVFSSSHIIENLSDQQVLETDRLTAICRRHQINQQGMRAMLERFAGRKVVVVGDLMADTYVYCDASDVASEAPTLSLAVLEEAHFLGAAGIVSAHLAAMGAKPFLVSTVGRDEWSRWATKQLSEMGISSYLQPSRADLVRKLRYMADGQKLFKADYGLPTPLDSIAERAVAGALLDAATDADALIWCDYGYGTVTDGLIGRVGDALRRRVDLIAADISSRGRLLRFGEVDLLTPTEKELRASIGDFDSGLSHVAWQVLHKTQAGRLMVTLGKKGVVLFDRPSQDRADTDWEGRLVSEYLPALGGSVGDPLGCGDAFLAAATLAMASEANVLQASYLASAAAAAELVLEGNIPVGTNELLQVLARRRELGEAEWSILPAGPAQVPLPADRLEARVDERLEAAVGQE